MTHGRKLRLRSLFFIITFTIGFTVSCRQSAKPPTPEPATAMPGEPETYTATIVRSIEDNQHNEMTETRVVRSGDMRREEWTDKGEKLALIIRFDSGKSFLLNLNKQIYTETDLALKAPEKSKPGNAADTPNAVGAAKTEPEASRPAATMDFVEDNFAEEPLSTENRVLADEYIASQLCKVTEKRDSFADGRTEITKTFCAENLLGMAIKTEKETIGSPHRVKVITEWRDIKLVVSADDFVVPATFKKVQSFSAP
jgi:hypothetical protein